MRTRRYSTSQSVTQKSSAPTEQNAIAQGKRSATLGHELIEVPSPERAKLFSPALKGNHAIAQGNALGEICFSYSSPERTAYCRDAF